MTRTLTRILCTVFLLFLSAFPVLAGQQFPQYVLDTLANATVMVSVQTGDHTSMEVHWGTGMIIAPGLVVTNAHVVNEKGPARIMVHNRVLVPTPAKVVAARYDSNEFETGHVVEYIANTLASKANLSGNLAASKQRNYDMAILSFTPPPGFAVTPLSFSRQAFSGESIIAAGYPGDNGASFSSPSGGFPTVPSAPLIFSGGTVSGVINKSPQLVIHSARCSTGNSGGPVVNARGEILGMQTWTSVPGSSRGYMSLAIGSRDIVSFLEQRGIRPRVTGYDMAGSEPEAIHDMRPEVLGRANTGDPDAMALAGLYYFLGDYGFTRNDQAAVHYLQNAVNMSSYHPHGYLYKAGLAAVLFQAPDFWRPDYAESLLRSANSTEYGSGGVTGPDLHLLAYEASLRMQGKAYGVQYDANRSLQLAEQALAGGFALPFALAGYHYYFGDSYAGRDHAKALRYARQAASNNIPEGISLLAHLYYDSDVVPKTDENRRTARRLAEEAVVLGDAWGYGLLATMCYEAGTWTEKVRALKYALLGTCFGNRLAVFCLGRIAWDSWRGNQGDFSQAVRAWAYMDWAERRGVGLGTGVLGGGVRSSEEILSGLGGYSEARERVMGEGRREQGMLEARRNTRPRIPLQTVF